jgi:hypothetical protein
MAQIEVACMYERTSPAGREDRGGEGRAAGQEDRGGRRAECGYSGRWAGVWLWWRVGQSVATVEGGLKCGDGGGGYRRR